MFIHNTRGMLLTNNTLHLSKDETIQLVFLLNTDEGNIKALRHRPDKLLKRIESVLLKNKRLDSLLKLMRAYFLPEWKKKLSIYKE